MAAAMNAPEPLAGRAEAQTESTSTAATRDKRENLREDDITGPETVAYIHFIGVANVNVLASTRTSRADDAMTRTDDDEHRQRWRMHVTTYSQTVSMHALPPSPNIHTLNRSFDNIYDRVDSVRHHVQVHTYART